uniref:PrnX protein n=1 Tax=Emericella nidulans TaxID=162425 RepID=Q9HEN2_EMEND|nr:PrnX protein [Aspergillus nidulans]
MYLLPEPAVGQLLRDLTRPQCLSFLRTLDTALLTVSAQSFSPPEERLVHQPLRTAITAKDNNLSLFMPVSNTSSTGIKIVTASQSHGIIGVINIFSPKGELLGLLSAAEITAFRTALTVMSLFVRVTSSGAAAGIQRERIVILGSGRQAEWHARLALLLCPGDIRRMTFVNRGRKRLEELERGVISNLKNRYPDVEFTTLSKEGNDHYEEHLCTELALSDVIFSCTPSTEPNFPYSYLAGGTGAGAGSERYKAKFISLIGSYRPHMQEIDTETLLSGGWHCFMLIRGRLVSRIEELIKAGMKGDQLVELGELYQGQELGENKDEGPQPFKMAEGQNVVMKCVGMGIMDLVTGRKLLELGRERNIGVEVNGF